MFPCRSRAGRQSCCLGGSGSRTCASGGCRSSSFIVVVLCLFEFVVRKWWHFGGYARSDAQLRGQSVEYQRNVLYVGGIINFRFNVIQSEVLGFVDILRDPSL